MKNTRDTWIQYIREHTEVQIFIIQDYMTEQYAELFKQLNPYFISDIRSSIHKTSENMPNDLDVVWNQAMQFVWVNIMSPKGFMLKFRAPYFDVDVIQPTDIETPVFNLAKKMGIDFVSDFTAKKFTYLDGTIYMQPWMGRSSSETRLVAKAPYRLKQYNIYEFENKIFYYNVIERGFVHHINPEASKQLGFDHCNDCSLEALIWRDYYNKFKKSGNIIEAVKQLSYIVKRNLFREIHGRMFNPDLKYVNDVYKQMQK
jgi:hypothetical protein